MNIVLAGSHSVLSSTVFHHLTNSGHSLRAVVVSQRRHGGLKSLIPITCDDIELLAMQAGIEVIALDDEATAFNAMQACAADVLIVACYPGLISASLAAQTRLGGFNLHPSLLPKYRGPEPLFWQFRDGADFGVSVHRLSAQFDAGDLVAQQKLSLADGCDYHDALHSLATAAAQLLLDCLPQWQCHGVTATAQNASSASYHPYPVASDFVVDCQRSAQGQFNFMCGTRVFGHPWRCDTPMGSLWLAEALACDAEASLAEAVIIDGASVQLQCAPGVLKARLAARK